MGPEGFNKEGKLVELDAQVVEGKEVPRAIKEFKEFAPAIRANSIEVSTALESLTNDDWVNFDALVLNPIGFNYESMKYVERSAVPQIVQGITEFRTETDSDKRNIIAKELRRLVQI